MKYTPKPSEILSVNDVKDGDKLIIVTNIEQVQGSNGDTYLNCKVQLADGSKKTLGLFDAHCIEFAKAWGDEMDDWTGHTVTVEIKVSKKGNKWIMLTPSNEEKIDVPKSEISASNEEENINPDDIPF